jgi:hypothetical protein
VAVGVPHTAITASPMNFSTVPPYRVNEVPTKLEVAGEQLSHLFRVSGLGEGGEVNQVGEQHRDEAALRDRRGELRGGRRIDRFSERRPAVAAEPLFRRVLGPAGGTGDGESGATVPAKPLPARALGAAIRASGHDRS